MEQTARLSARGGGGRTSPAQQRREALARADKPEVERVELFTRVLVDFLTGDEDMHLKNFSVITREGVVSLSPAYDPVNTTPALGGGKEETALPLHGKKRGLSRNDSTRHLALERLGLRKAVADEVVERLESVQPAWRALVDVSFLPEELRDRYRAILDERTARLWG